MLIESCADEGGMLLAFTPVLSVLCQEVLCFALFFSLEQSVFIMTALARKSRICIYHVYIYAHSVMYKYDT